MYIYIYREREIERERDYIYIYIYIERERGVCVYIYIYIMLYYITLQIIMGGAPRNPALRNHFLVWTVKPSGCHCTDAFGGKDIVECRPLLGALPLL